MLNDGVIGWACSSRVMANPCSGCGKLHSSVMANLRSGRGHPVVLNSTPNNGRFTPFFSGWPHRLRRFAMTVRVLYRFIKTNNGGYNYPTPSSVMANLRSGCGKLLSSIMANLRSGCGHPVVFNSTPNNGHFIPFFSGCPHRLRHFAMTVRVLYRFIKTNNSGYNHPTPPSVMANLRSRCGKLLPSIMANLRSGCGKLLPSVMANPCSGRGKLLPSVMANPCSGRGKLHSSLMANLRSGCGHPVVFNSTPNKGHFIPFFSGWPHRLRRFAMTVRVLYRFIKTNNSGCGHKWPHRLRRFKSDNKGEKNTNFLNTTLRTKQS